MKVFTVVALGSVLAYAAFQQAGVDVRDWHWCLLAIGLIGVIHFLVARTNRHPRMDMFACVSLSVFVICAAVRAEAPPLEEEISRVEGNSPRPPRSWRAALRSSASIIPCTGARRRPEDGR